MPKAVRVRFGADKRFAELLQEDRAGSNQKEETTEKKQQDCGRGMFPTFAEEKKQGRRYRVTPLGPFVGAIGLRCKRCTFSVQVRSLDDPNDC